MVFLGVVMFLLPACTNRQNDRHSENAVQKAEDMAGRELVVPKQITRVASNNLPGTMLLYTLADSLLIARNNTPSGSEQFFCTESYCRLPLIGSWFSTNGTRNTEELIRMKPDLIVSAGNVGKSAAEITDHDQKLLKIPIMLISTNLVDLPRSYSLLGKLLGREEKASELIAFYEKYIPGIISETATIDSAKRKRIYIAMGEEGLLTPPASSLHSQVVKFAGGQNVAEINLFDRQITSHATVSIEQVINWNPEIILACGIEDVSSENVKQNLMTNKQWAGISAIKSGQVYQVPASPYLWLDRPPSINQVIGVIWLAKLLYPDRFTYDMNEITKEFYRKFYHRKLTDQEARKILNNQK